jgi:cyanophycin synthetase
VPVHVRVGSEQEAVEAARRLGYPVVVKPADRDGGRGVFAGLWNDEVLRGAWREAARLSRRVLVEKHFDGEDYRFTVVHGEVVKIMHRVPGGVTGDGLADVATLVERVKARESHRRAFRREGKWRLSLDREAMELLGEQGLDGGSVPPAGRFVRLRRKSNISAGGEHALVPLEAVHPDNADLAIRATAAIGLDIAGIDLILPDVGRAWHETGAIVCEVNAKPQIGRRDTPEIYADILRRLVSGDGSVPVHLLVVRGEAQDGHASFAARNARRLGCNAFSCPAGAWVEGRRTVWRPADAFAAAQAMLLDGRVASALVCMTLGDVLRSGLPAARLAGVLLAAEVADAGAAAQRRSLLRMLEGHGGTVRVVRDARENEER